MLSRRIRYALRALSHLARHGHELHPSHLIAREEGLPLRFLEAILGELRQAGLVESISGLRGGFRLRPPAFQLSVLDVIELLGTELAPLPCLANRATRCSYCPPGGGCSLRSTFAPGFEHYRSRLAATAISELPPRGDPLGEELAGTLDASGAPRPAGYADAGAQAALRPARAAV
jgi:Rrf2 family protein